MWEREILVACSLGKPPPCGHLLLGVELRFQLQVPHLSEAAKSAKGSTGTHWES